MIIKTTKTQNHKITLSGKAGKYVLTNTYKMGDNTRIHRMPYNNLETAKMCFDLTVETTEFMEKITPEILEMA
jgi:hypothetical protein